MEVHAVSAKMGSGQAQEVPTAPRVGGQRQALSLEEPQPFLHIAQSYRSVSIGKLRRRSTSLVYIFLNSVLLISKEVLLLTKKQTSQNLLHCFIKYWYD